MQKLVYWRSDAILTPLGAGTQANMEAIQAGRSGIAWHPTPAWSARSLWAARIDDALMESACDQIPGTRLERMSIAALRMALSGAADFDLQALDTVLVLASTKGNIAEEGGGVWDWAERLAAASGNPNRPIVVCNACISGLTALETAWLLLREGKYTRAVVLAADELSEFVVSGFDAFKALSDQVCRPYDAARNGINLGEAAAAVLLCTQTVSPLCLYAAAGSNDANHISGPSRTGDGLYLAIRRTLDVGGIKNENLDWLCLHGTATRYNDDMESRALALAGLSGTPAHSLKGYFGHTLGAAALLETVLCAESLRSKWLPPSLGFETLDTPEPMNILAQPQTLAENARGLCLKTASGFGGCNGALVLGKSGYASEPSILSFPYRRVVRHRLEIQHGAWYLDGALLYAFEPNFEDMVRAAYKTLGLTYPKFYKMDALSKLAFLGAEVLLSELPDKQTTSVLLSNRHSTLDSDRQHQASIADRQAYYPSPAVFAYTLPNVAVGEICIRHGIQQNNAFFISATPDWEFLFWRAEQAFVQNSVRYALVGWVEALPPEYALTLYLMEKVG